MFYVSTLHTSSEIITFIYIFTQKDEVCLRRLDHERHKQSLSKH